MNIRFESPSSYKLIEETNYNEVFEFAGEYYIRTFDSAILIRKISNGGKVEYVLGSVKWLFYVYSQSPWQRFPKSAKVQTVGTLIFEMD